MRCRPAPAAVRRPRPCSMSTKSSHSRYSSRLPLIASKKRFWIACVSSPGSPEQVVVDLAHGHDLGRGAGQEDLVGLVQLAARDVALGDLEARGRRRSGLTERGRDPVEDRGARRAASRSARRAPRRRSRPSPRRRCRGRRAGSPRRSRPWRSRPWRGSSSGTGREAFACGMKLSDDIRRQEATLQRIPWRWPSSPR